MPILGTVASQFSGKFFSSYESIASSSPTSGSTVTFSSIPSTYQHLQIRINMICTSSAAILTNFNSDFNSNYAMHGLFGTGSTVEVNSGSGQVNIQPLGQYGGTITTYSNVAIIDIHDYASTSKYKTLRSFGGFDKNAAGGEVDLVSGLWMNTSAITSVRFALSGGSYSSGTTFALYGIKG
jgi:hypothetical protein